MSHLLYLNSCDNYPNKCPHICLHLIVKQHPNRKGQDYPEATAASSGKRIIPISFDIATEKTSHTRIYSSPPQEPQPGE